jgi:hypothetical protein
VSGTRSLYENATVDNIHQLFLSPFLLSPTLLFCQRGSGNTGRG